MEVLKYDNYQWLRDIFCKDCMKRERKGCKDMDPMDCNIVKGYFIERNEDGYQIQVGKFIIKPIIEKEVNHESVDR